MTAWQRLPKLRAETQSDAYAHAGFWYLFCTMPLLAFFGILYRYANYPGRVWPFVAFALILPIIRWGKIMLHVRRRTRQLKLLAG